MCDHYCASEYQPVPVPKCYLSIKCVCLFVAFPWGRATDIERLCLCWSVSCALEEDCVLGLYYIYCLCGRHAYKGTGPALKFPATIRPDSGILDLTLIFQEDTAGLDLTF